MLDRRLARSTSLRIEPEPLLARRDSSCCMPAFIAAAAASECGGVWEPGGGEACVRVGSGLAGAMRDCSGEAEAEGDGEGGKEFRSGGMVGCGTR